MERKYEFRMVATKKHKNNIISYLDFITRGFNLDSTFRCPLMCPNCKRQTDYTNHGKVVPGEDLDIINFMKIIKYLKYREGFKNKYISFEGQYSDPVHHPKFLEMLELCYKHKVGVSVQNASSNKSRNWYIKAFKTS